jgi:hypothetical protein
LTAKRSSLPLAVGLMLAATALFLLAYAGPASAAAAALHFQETEKGATFAFVDNAPKSKLRHGFPTEISAGDMIVLTNPLLEGGKKIGKLSASCVATQTSRKFDGAGFECTGTFVLPKGTLIISGSGVSEGAIIGGTGQYAGARGTFTTKETKGPVSPVTVTLLE